jgi:hypothetical protein
MLVTLIFLKDEMASHCDSQGSSPESNQVTSLQTPKKWDVFNAEEKKASPRLALVFKPAWHSFIRQPIGIIPQFPGP